MSVDLIIQPGQVIRRKGKDETTMFGYWVDSAAAGWPATRLEFSPVTEGRRSTLQGYPMARLVDSQDRDSQPTNHYRTESREGEGVLPSLSLARKAGEGFNGTRHHLEGERDRSL